MYTNTTKQLRKEYMFELLESDVDPVEVMRLTNEKYPKQTMDDLNAELRYDILVLEDEIEYIQNETDRKISVVKLELRSLNELLVERGITV